MGRQYYFKTQTNQPNAPTQPDLGMTTYKEEVDHLRTIIQSMGKSSVQGPKQNQGSQQATTKIWANSQI